MKNLENNNQITSKQETFSPAQEQVLLTPEMLKKDLDEKLEKINERSDQASKIPEYHIRQIQELGGDVAMIQEKVKQEIQTVLQKIRDIVKGKFAKIAGAIGVVAGGFFVDKLSHESDQKILNRELSKIQNREESSKSYSRKMSENPDLFVEEQKRKMLRELEENRNKINEIQTDPQKYIERRSQEKFAYLSSEEGKQQILNNYKRMLTEDGWKQFPPDMEKIKREIENGTWQPSMDEIKQEYVREVESYKTIGFPSSESLDQYEQKELEYAEKNAREISGDKSDQLKKSFETVDPQLAWMNKTLQSPEYKRRALQHEKLSKGDIKERIERINRHDYNIEDREKYDEKHPQSAGVYYMDGYSNPKSGKVFLKQEYISKEDYSTGVHEFTHQSTDGERNMSRYARNLYQEAFTDQNITQGEYSFEGVDYWGDPTELDARKKETEYFMEKQGIKKYAEKFTNEHYNKLLELQKQGKLPASVDQIIRFIKPEYIEQIMNTIADTGMSPENGFEINQA